MREPTKEERDSVNKYIKDNSKEIRIKFFEDLNKKDNNNNEIVKEKDILSISRK